MTVVLMCCRQCAIAREMTKIHEEVGLYFKLFAIVSLLFDYCCWLHMVFLEIHYVAGYIPCKFGMHISSQWLLPIPTLQNI